MRLADFYLQPNSTLLAAEHLSPAGVSPALAERVQEAGRLSAEWLELFQASVAAYLERAEALAKQLPREFGPARLPNVCVAHEPDVAHPTYAPLWRSCWLVYRSDFDPQLSNVEFGVYQLIRAEGLLLSSQDARATLRRGLTYLLTLNKNQLRLLRQACRKTPRLDARAYQALADALAWIPELTHTQLGRSPAAPRTSGGPPGPPRPVLGTSLVAPSWVAPRLDTLQTRFEKTAEQVRLRHRSGDSPPEPPLGADALLSWLAEATPELLVTDRQGKPLWDPARPTETSALAEATQGMGAQQAEDVRRDLERVDTLSRKFWATIPNPDALPMPSEEITQADGTYLHTERRMVAYSLSQNSWEPLTEPSPPLKRLALGARVIHEWGHLCEESGWLGVPEARAKEHKQARQAMVEAFKRLVAGVPKRARPQADRELASLKPKSASPAERLTRFSLIRFSDYLANVLMQRYLDPAELETYVRVNLTTHIGEPIPPLQHLARASLEFQYLRLSQVPDPLAYFYQVSAIDRLFFATGFVRKEDYEHLLQAQRAYCECYEIDESRFQDRPPAPGAAGRSAAER